MKLICTEVSGQWPVVSGEEGGGKLCAREEHAFDADVRMEVGARFNGPSERMPPSRRQKHGTRYGTRWNRRGTAEIELMLVIPVLLVILFLVGGSLLLGRGRMSNAYNAENDAYTQVVAGRGFAESSDPVPPEGYFMPVLPNRYVTADELQNIQIRGIRPPINKQLSDRGILLDPAWHYSAWPQGGDGPMIQAWFAAYVGESHPAEIVQALGLRPATPP
jgi:hypothetical protein